MLTQQSSSQPLNFLVAHNASLIFSFLSPTIKHQPFFNPTKKRFIPLKQPNNATQLSLSIVLSSTAGESDYLILNCAYIPVEGSKAMKLFLVRHGETVDNVAGIYAGVRNSALTNHGVLQATRLGAYLADSGVKISHIFSSDLQRAFKTAEAIRQAQSPTGIASSSISCPHQTTPLLVLREQDFGYFEGKPFYARPSGSNQSGKEAALAKLRLEPGFVDIESRESMKKRADTFIDEYLLDVLVGGAIPLNGGSHSHAVVIVSHGIFLAHLWRSLLLRFSPSRVSAAPDLVAPLEHVGSAFSNTGYLELELQPLPTLAQSNPSTKVPYLNMSLVVKASNSVEHLKGLKKTRGGIGSSKYDEGQKKIETFFTKNPTTES